MEKIILTQFKNQIPQFLWWKDLDSKFLDCNTKFAKFAGFENEQQMIGKTDHDCWNKSEADFFRKIDLQVIETGKSKLEYEEFITVPNIGKRWLSTSKIPWYDDNNNIIGTIGWFNDITSLKEMQIILEENNKTLLNYSLQLEQANKKLEIANMYLEKFTYAASHDLKEPIRTLKIFAKLLKKQKNLTLDKESKEYIDFISKSANRMGTLIDDILSYARTGSTDLKTEQILIENIVKGKIADLKHLIESKSASINISLPTKEINCYPQLTGLIFYNLINNGIKFNDSPTPEINCSFTEDNTHWIFGVEDNGIGIDKKNAKKIFLPFKRLVGECYEGSGIGLSICKRVANLHKGEIWLEKSNNGNTLFKFSISKDL